MILLMSHFQHSFVLGPMRSLDGAVCWGQEKRLND